MIDLCSDIGYKSVNDYIKLAVMEKLERDEKILR